LSPKIAPFKAIVLPMSNDGLEEITELLLENLNKFGISHKVDRSSNAIGRKYARADDIGIPFAITIDLNSNKDKKVTLRERDSCTQIRCEIKEAVQIVQNLLDNKIKWEEALNDFQEQKQTASLKVGINKN